jgi:hypothetical protein
MEFYSREIQIMRQSQLKLAFEYLQNEGIHVSITELHRVTDVFVELCLRPMDKDLKDRVKALEKWINDKKLGNDNDTTK